MGTQTTIEYEVTVPETEESFITYNREEALKRYAQGCMVFEIHKTITTPSVNMQTRVYVTWRWNNNSEFEEM